MAKVLADLDAQQDTHRYPKAEYDGLAGSVIATRFPRHDNTWKRGQLARPGAAEEAQITV